MSRTETIEEVSPSSPNGNRPSGLLARNTFLTCPGVPAIYVNAAVPGCADDLIQVNNTIDKDKVVEMPQVSFSPPPPSSTATSGTYRVIGVTSSAGATIRYTLDGSRPTEDSPQLSPKGIDLHWPSSTVAVNMRAFKAGMRPSVTNGAILELSYVLGRMAPYKIGALNGVLDGVNLSAAIVRGWVVDTALPNGGIGSVAVSVYINNTVVAACLANEARPELPKAGVAPNPEHGFTCTLPSTILGVLQNGSHIIEVMAIGSPSSEQPSRLRGGSLCVVDGKVSRCRFSNSEPLIV